MHCQWQDKIRRRCKLRNKWILNSKINEQRYFLTLVKCEFAPLMIKHWYKLCLTIHRRHCNVAVRIYTLSVLLLMNIYIYIYIYYWNRKILHEIGHTYPVTINPTSVCNYCIRFHITFSMTNSRIRSVEMSSAYPDFWLAEPIYICKVPMHVNDRR